MKHATTMMVVLALLVVGCGTGGSATVAKAERPETVEVPFSAETDQSSRSVAVVQESRHANRRTVSLSVPADRIGLGGTALWVNTGRGWTLHATYDGRPASVDFTSPADGLYAFHLSRVSEKGEAKPEPSSDTKPDYLFQVDTLAPVVEMLSPNGGEVFGAKRPTQVSWMCEDANLGDRPITLWVSTDGGVNWIEQESNLPNSGRIYWTTPESSSESYRVKIVAKDRAGNAGEDMSDKPFAVDGLAPDVRLLGPSTATFVPVDVNYRAHDLGGAGLRRVTFYISRDGGRSWEPIGEDADLASPFGLTVLDGSIGLWVVGEDGVGNMSPVPTAGCAPMLTTAVDTTPPHVTLLAPKGGTYQGGQRMDIQWTARDNLDMPVECVTLFYSDDDGKNWKLAAERITNTGSHSWLVPSTGTRAARIRLNVRDTMGNVREVPSEAFAIETLVPEAALTGPTRSKSNVFALDYDIRNRGEAPLEGVILWWRPKGGTDWARYGEDPDATSPMSFLKTDGEYDLYLTCATTIGVKSGICQKPPTPATSPQITVVIDATPPAIVLRSFDGGGSVRAGETREIAWDLAEAHPTADGLKIEHSVDGVNWESIAIGVNPRDQRYAWTVPRSTGRVHYLRLTCVDDFDNRLTVTSSRPFYIDLHPPMVKINKVPSGRVRVRRVPVSVEGGDDVSGIDRIEAWGRLKGSTAGYERRASMNGSVGDLAVELPQDGEWEIAIVSYDRVNQASRDLAVQTDPDFTVTIDTAPPRVELTRRTAPNGKPVYVNDRYEMEWQAVDEQTPAEKLRSSIDYSIDGGLTWTNVAQGIGGTQFAADRFLQPGQKFRLRVAVADEAGNVGRDESADFDIDTLPALAIRIQGIEPGAKLVTGSTVEIAWVTVHGVARGATVRLSRDGGASWDAVASVSGDRYTMTLPATPGLYQVQVSAQDRFGKEITSNAVAFNLDHPPVRAITAELARDAAEGTAYAPGEEVRVKWSIAEVGEPFVELRVEVQGPGRDWEAVQKLTPSDRVYTYVLPDGLGQYLLRVRGTDAMGRTVYSNGLRVAVPEPTQARVEFALIPTKGSYDAGSRVTVAWTPTVEVGEAWLELSSDGANWASVKKAESKSFHFEMPDKVGKYGLRLSYTDKGGKNYNTGTITAVVVMPAAPSIGFALDAETGEAVPPGAAIGARWTGNYDQLARLWIQIGTDDGWTDREVAPLDLAAQFPAPSQGGSYRVRLRWVDVHGREGFTTREARVRVAGEFRAIAGRMVTVEVPAGGVARAALSTESFAIAASSVRVEIRAEASKSPVEAPAARLRDGVVSFGAPMNPGRYWVRAYGGEAGAFGRTAELALTVTERRADDPAPTLTIETMRGGDVYLGGSGQILVFKTGGPIERDDVAVELSRDSGKTWRRLHEEEIVRLGGGVNFKLPRETAAAYRARVVWTLRPDVADASASDFSIDSTPPSATIKPLAEIQTDRVVNIEAEIKSSLAPVDRLRLYASSDEGRTWQIADTFKVGEAVAFAPPAPGRYDLFLMAISTVELSNGEPKAGTPPHATVRFDPGEADPSALSVRVDRRVPPVLKGGTEYTIEWVGMNGRDAKVDLYLYSKGARAGVIAEGLADFGTFGWVVPGTDLTDCELRVCIRRGKEEAWDRSTRFAIDASAPEVDGVDVNGD